MSCLQVLSRFAIVARFLDVLYSHSIIEDFVHIVLLSHPTDRIGTTLRAAGLDDDDYITLRDHDERPNIRYRRGRTESEQSKDQYYENRRIN